MTTTFDAVIDFSAFKRSEVKRVLPYLKKNNTLVYIFISSDSVYEVCVKEDDQLPTKESDDVRPTDHFLRKKLKEKDDYGHDKLKCEEYIREFCSTCRLNYVILRLADVIGTRDGTDRWWQYQLWIKACVASKLPLYIPASFECTDQQLSFVYVNDIARLVCRMINRSVNVQTTPALNGAYNLACEETLTLTSFLHKVFANTQQSGTLVVRPCHDTSVPHIYPSVEKGPIDISKAKKLLNWQPTRIDDAISQIVAFYEDVCDQQLQYKSEKADIFETIMDENFEDVKFYTKQDLKQMRKFLTKTLQVT